MRVVLDTNIFISGIFWEGNICSQIIDAWKKGKFELITSISLIEEFIKTLKEFKIQMDEKMIKEWNNIIIENSILVGPKEKLDIIKEDPDDNKFFEVAITGKAKYIVSQDKHLLNIGDYQGIKVVPPEEFLQNL